MQETKLQEKHVEDAQEEVGLPDWSHAWNCSTVLKGYSGTDIISRCVPSQSSPFVFLYRSMSTCCTQAHAWNSFTILKGYRHQQLAGSLEP